MLTPFEKKELREKLVSLNNVDDMFKELGRQFDLKETKPGSLTKPLFVDGILKGIDMLNPPKK